MSLIDYFSGFQQGEAIYDLDECPEWFECVSV